MIANVLPNGSLHGRDLDAFADIVRRFAHGGARRLQLRERGGRIGHAPVRDGPVRTGRAVRDQAQFETADVEADVERLVEVGRDTQHAGVPRLAARQDR